MWHWRKCTGWVWNCVWCSQSLVLEFRFIMQWESTSSVLLNCMNLQNRSVMSKEVCTTYSTLVILNWAHMCSILAWGTFYIACRSISSHINFSERLLVSHVTEFNSAKKIHECLLKYSEKVLKSLTPWFAVHSSLFGFVILLTLLDIMNTIQSSQKKSWHKQNLVIRGYSILVCSYSVCIPFFVC